MAAAAEAGSLTPEKEQITSGVEGNLAYDSSINIFLRKKDNPNNVNRYSWQNINIANDVDDLRVVLIELVQ